MTYDHPQKHYQLCQEQDLKYPVIEVEAAGVSIGHEASVSRVNDEQLFYLMSRGLSESEANTWWSTDASSRS